MPASVILATAGYGHTIKFWEASTGNYYRTLQFPESQVNALQITPDKHYIAAAGNPNIQVFEAKTSNSEPVITFEGHTTNVTAIGFPKHSKWLYSASEDGTMKLWDMRVNGHQKSVDNINKAPINTVALHPNHSELIIGDSDGNVRIWDMTADKWQTSACLQPDVAVQSISVALDGRLVVVANNMGNCFLWNPTSSETFESDPEHSLSTSSVAVRAHERYILKCQISPDRKLLATASADRTVRIWSIQDSKTLQLHKVLDRHQRWVHDCVFSADSSYLVTACSDLSAYLWDLSQGEMIRHYTHDKAVVAVALNDSSSEG